MNPDETLVRDRLDELAAHVPAPAFTPADVIARGRHRRRLRTTVAAGLTAAAVAGIAVATPALLPGRPAVTPAPAATLPSTSAILTGCAHREAASTGHATSQVLRGLRVFDVVTDAAGTQAVLYGPEVFIHCVVEHGRYVVDHAVYNDMRWLHGEPLDIDMDDAISGSPSAPVSDGIQPPLPIVAGRVTPAVASVLVRVGERTVRLRPVDGTYFVRFVEPLAPALPVVTAYDARGRVLATVQSRNGPLTTCYAAPDGTVVFGAPTDRNCTPAVRWPYLD
jgi:hypothetical protein